MRAPNVSIIFLLPLLAAASPQAGTSSSSATTTLTSTSTRTITHTMIQGTETLTSTYLSLSPVALTASHHASSLPDISAPSGIIDTTASLIVAPYPSSTPTRRLGASSSVASLGTAAPQPSATGAKPEPFKGAASGRPGFGIAGLSAVIMGAMALVGSV